MGRFSRFLPIVPTSLVALVAAFVGTTGVPAPGDRALDPDRDDRLAMGRLAFRDNCLMCHSEEMTTRSRLTEKQWATEIDKMIGWGAPVPADLKGPLLEFLVSAYSDPGSSPVAAPERISPRAALDLVSPDGPLPRVGDVAQGASLYKAHCATCHGPEARGGDLGTALVEKTVLLRPSEYSGIVRKGLRRMPGFEAALNPERESDILAWLRTRRFEIGMP